MKNYGEILKEHRIVRGLTLKEIEMRTGINNGSLSRWERNEVSPSIESCVQLANFYGITLDELLGFEDNWNGRIPAPIAPTVTPASDVLTAKEKALLEAFGELLPETQDFILRTAQSLCDVKVKKV